MSPSPKDSADQVEWVSADIIRKIFNDGQYYQKVLDNILTTIIKEDSLLTKLPIGEPPGTRSQMVFYVDHQGKVVALVHQYLRPDGSIGASGKPDPKKLIVEDRIIATKDK